VKLLLDEMYPATLAEQLRARGHDVVAIHEAAYRRLEGAADAEVLAAAIEDERALVTENVPDFRRLEAALFEQGGRHFGLVFTTNRQFPRGAASTLGQLVTALDALLGEAQAPGTIFLKPAT
jgi:predicted nuclease of predicted toxin-antitoxin system